MATLSITRGTTLPDSSSKSDFHNLVDTATGSVSNIVNNDIDAAAAIADTKLARITTASKVSGTALSVMACLPCSAGVIPNANTVGGAIEVVFDNSGTEIEDASHIEVFVPKAITLTGWYMLSDVSGSIQVDVWCDTFANYPPTNDDSLCNGHEPAISSATSASDTDISDWKPGIAISANSVLKFYVDSCTTITKCTLVLTFVRN